MYKAIFFVCLGFLWSSILLCQVVEIGSLKGFIYGSAPECEYDDWISHQVKKIASNNYNTYAPFYRYGTSFSFGTFRAATSNELELWDFVVRTFVQGEYAIAEELIFDFGFPYSVVEFHDTDTSRVYYMLRENLNYSLYDDQGTPELSDDVYGGFDYGWGLYIMSPESQSRIIVNTPHPGDDFLIPPIMVSAFQKWDARYLAYAAAGREALWTNSGSYTNEKSLSDPSRYADHPFNNFYRAACDEIREGQGVREFSAQIHSFDWNSNIHTRAPYAQVSAGHGRTAGPIRVNYSRSFPSLPIRDFSSHKMDLINQTDYLVIPENTIGIHPPVYINDYYGVYYTEDEAPFIYDNGEVSFKVNDYVSLWGAETNVQFLYTLNQQDRYNVISNFFHIEMAELPHCYPRSQNTYRWFYGYDIATGTYDMAHRFDNALAFYSPIIDNMIPVLEAAFLLNDNQTPPTPENFTITGVENTKIHLAWDPVDSYDFMTYEIHYSTLPNNPGDYVVTRDIPFTTTSYPSTLATATTGSYILTGLENNTTYYISMLAMDYNGNYSAFTEEIAVTTIPANLYNLVSITLENGTTLTWNGTNQYNIIGYKIYRATFTGDYTLLADWESHPILLKTSNTQNYQFLDDTGELFENYKYQIAMVSEDLEEFWSSDILYGYPRPIFKIYAENREGNITDNITIGYGPHTSDGIDSQTYYDLVKTGNPPAQYTDIDIWKENWSSGGSQGVRLRQEYIGEFDLNTEVKVFRVRVRSNQAQVYIRCENTLRESAKAILVDVETNTAVNLLNDTFTYRPQNTSYKLFDLYLGNAQPSANISQIPNRIFLPGQSLSINITLNLPLLIEQCKVALMSDIDSLFVSDSFTPADNPIHFTFPDNITMHNLQPVIDIYSIDGEVKRFYGNGAAGIIPAERTITYQPGNSFVANPFTQQAMSLADINPAGSLHLLGENEWMTTSEMFFGTGYLLNIPELFTQDYTYNFQQGGISTTLYSGWNLIPNPFFTELPISSINLYFDNTAYSFAELYQQNIVLPTARVIRDNTLLEVDTIYPLESFMFYINLPDEYYLTANIVPYAKQNPIYSSLFTWQSILSVKSVTDPSINDNITLSASDLIHNPKRDLALNTPKTLKLPDNISFYLTQNDLKYTSRSIERLSDTAEDYYEIPFTIELPDLEPLQFEDNRTISDLDYNITMILDGLHYNLTDNTPINYYPIEPIINGTIRITNEFYVSNIDEVPKPFALSTYPNPFNPTTNIHFYLPESSLVELNIYNIRGQKVNTLAHEVLSPGDHTIQWHGIDSYGKKVSTGIYLLSLNVKGQDRVLRKITLLK